MESAEICRFEAGSDYSRHLTANITLRLSKKVIEEKLFDLTNQEFFGEAKLKSAVILPYYKR